MSLEMSKEKEVFVGEYLKKARPWPYLPKMHLYEDKVLLELDFDHYDDDVIGLEQICTISFGSDGTPWRRQGSATRALEFICDLADKNGLTIVGYIQVTRHHSDLEKPPNKPRLRTWYRKHKFKVDQNYRMVRHPQTSRQVCTSLTDK